jgi:hypothetical protein
MKIRIALERDFTHSNLSYQIKQVLLLKKETDVASSAFSTVFLCLYTYLLFINLVKDDAIKQSICLPEENFKKTLKIFLNNDQATREHLVTIAIPKI